MQKEYIKASVVGLADETSLQREPGRDLLELKLGNTARRLSGIAGFLNPPTFGLSDVVQWKKAMTL